MSNYTTPTTRSTDDLISAAIWNADMVENIKHLHEAINSVVIIEERQTQGTDGGTFTSGAWQTRTLNTEASDTAGVCALASNQMTLDAGTWEVVFWAVARGCELHQTRFQNVTDASTIAWGATSDARNADTLGDTVNVQNISMGADRFTIAAGKALELQHRCTQTKATDGFGKAANVTTEVYAQVWLRKVA